MRKDMSRIIKQGYFLKSLAKGIRVLELMAETNRPLSITEIARDLGQSKTTATRICYTLSKLTLISQDEHNKYRLTPNVLKLGYGAICSLGWKNVASYYLNELADTVGATVNLSILDGPDVLYLARIRKGEFFPFDIQVGSKAPAQCTAMGKVLVAFGSPKNRELALKSMTFRAVTIHSIRSLEEYMDELERVRSKGFATNYEELSIGVCGVGAPIMDEQGEAIAAIGVAVGTAEYSREALEQELAPLVMTYGKRISQAIQQMGYTDIKDKRNYK